MPHWPFFSAVTRWTVSPSVHVAHRPFLAKPRSVSERRVTPLTGLAWVPVTQMPLPALAQVLSAVAGPGTMTVGRVPEPRTVRSDTVMRTLSW